ncbi:MAG: cation:proton antiporter [Caulobacteraceae bacterium]
MENQIPLLVGGAAVAGVAAQWVGWRFRVPAIIPLLILGALVGPIFGWVKPDAMLGATMRPTIGMVVAIIVFEGGLNLNLRELRSAGSGVIRLVVLALPLNWLFGSLAGHFIGHMAWSVAILFGSILVVTGPTVIMPLLRQAKLEPRAASFLKWEAIVNDPLGASLTLLLLGYLLLLRQEGGDLAAMSSLTLRSVAGVVIDGGIGVGLPYLIRYAFHRDLAPEFLKTPLLLAGALAVYAAGESIAPETGLIGATLFGVTLANIDVTGLQELRRFKESLTVFLVSGLFILLTANIDPQVLRHISWPIVGTGAAILFLARPLAITLATIGAKVTWKERLLVGWIGPRGVVAAAVAGLAGSQLTAAGYRDGALILPMVFLVIAASVVLHGLTLGPLARLLGLASGEPPGLLIVGSSPFTIGLAQVLRAAGVPTLITDPDFQNLRPARQDGLRTLRIEILSGVGEEIMDLRGMEYLLAATGDDAYNALVCTRFAPDLGRERVHQPAFSVDSGQHVATSREWRGKIAIHDDLHHARLLELSEAGYVFRAVTVKEAGVIPDAPGLEGWPVLLVGAKGALSFFSPEHELSVAPGDQVIRFQAAPLEPVARVRRRRMRLRAARA